MASSALILSVVVHVALPLGSDASTISQPDWDLIPLAMDFTARMHFLFDSDALLDNESRYESLDTVDAVAVAEYPDTCIIAFQGTRYFSTFEPEAGEIPITIANIVDLLSNFGVLVQRDLESKTDSTKTCSVGAAYWTSYFNTPGFETKIDNACVAKGKRLIFAGHSQGAALAQFGAGKYLLCSRTNQCLQGQNLSRCLLVRHFPPLDYPLEQCATRPSSQPCLRSDPHQPFLVNAHFYLMTGLSILSIQNQAPCRT